MARTTTNDEIKKALSNTRVFIIKRKSADGAMSRWPFVAVKKEHVEAYLKEIDIPGCTHEFEDVFPAPTLIDPKSFSACKK